VTTRTWTLADNCGNAGVNYVQTITVTDTTAPTWSQAVGALNVSLDCGNAAGMTAALAAAPTATDNCSTAVVGTPTASTAAGNCAGNYVITRTWTVADNCGNAGANYVQTITVTDTTAPTWTQAAGALNANLDCANAAGIATALAAAPTATDNCSTAVVGTPTSSTATGICPSNYVITRTWTLADNCGNAGANYVQTITVSDTTIPEVDCPPDIAVPTDVGACSASVTFEAAATDTCDLAPAVVYYLNYGLPSQVVITSPHVFPLGVTTVTAVATDACTNVSIPCTFKVTVTATIRLSVGTGYTIMYPQGNPPSLAPTYTPYELAGPGNWVTVPISVSNPCGPLAQLVFEVTFPEYYDGSEGCFHSTDGQGLWYMVGTERWDEKRVQNATDWNDWAWTHGTTVPDVTGGSTVPLFDNETRVVVERGVGVDPNYPSTNNLSRLIVYMDSPTGDAVVNQGEGVFMYLMFRVSDDIPSFQQFALTPAVIYATDMAGLEVASQVEAGVVYADACNWLLDVDRNGRVDPDTDGVTLYRALKYGHLNSGMCSTVPILPPEYAAAAGEYLLSDAEIVAYVQSLLINYDLNVDNKTDAGDVVGIGLAAGASASRDGVYIYRNLGGFPTYIYPVYLGPLFAYTPFVNPNVPAAMGLTVPLLHVDNLGIQDSTINPQIDDLKVLDCGLPAAPTLPASWKVTLPGPTVKTLPLPQPVW
jgi:hypothetical protein